MYPPQSYDLPPVNPAAFGGLPQETPQPGAPPLASPSGGQPPPMDMNKYLIDKVAEIRQRMGAGDMGALSNIASAMQPPAQQPPAQEQQRGMA